jgi:S1-C subfamily serine protease
MLRALCFAAIASVLPAASFGQSLSVLHIKVVLNDPERGVTPVPRHRLLISDNPATTAPRLVITAADGTADVRLRPGNYTVESDRAAVFHGKAYQWTQMLDVVAGRDTSLELTADNAEVEIADATTVAADSPVETDPSLLISKWQDSVVALWTPTTHASGFVIDSKGLIATNQKVVGTATSVEVQLSAAVKVAANVLVADRGRDVAILRINPEAIAAVHAVPLACTAGDMRSIAVGQKIFTISSALREQTDMTSGTVNRVDPHRLVSDLDFASSGAGGPVFTADGTLIGITSVVDEKDQRRRDDSPVVRVEDACEVVAAAEQKLSNAAPPAATHLPIEPALPLPVDALKDAAEHRVGSLSPYQLATSAFDVSFITPVMTYGAQFQSAQAARRSGARGKDSPSTVVVSSALDFANWSEYVDAFPPVLLIRVTPKQVENFWTTVARGAAQTQGVSVPAMKHFNGSFLRMRAYCGSVEVIPIHPFKLERRVSDTEAIYEGLYAFDPGAFGPHCAAMKLSLYSEKEPEKEDARVVDSRMVEQIWRDFAPYRDSNK